MHVCVYVWRADLSSTVIDLVSKGITPAKEELSSGNNLIYAHSASLRRLTMWQVRVSLFV